MSDTSNRFRSISGHVQSLSPAEAEVWITAVAEQVKPTTEIRGRLVGPRCLSRTTVEVAYSLQPFPRRPEGLPPLTMQVIIPEPSMWGPQDPFLYRAHVELWENGQRCDVAGFDKGLRTLDSGEGTWYWNGRRLLIRGTTQLPESQEDWMRLRQAGYNLLVASEEQPLLWFTAYQVGFLMLGRLSLTDLSFERARVLGGQVSCFGWLLDAKLLESGAEGREFIARLSRLALPIGIELERVPSTPLPQGLSFVVCPERALKALASIKLPRMVMREHRSAESSPPAWATTSGILGWTDC